MAASPQRERPLDVSSIAQHFDIKSRESETETLARIEREKSESEHRRTVEIKDTSHRERLEFFLLGLFVCAAIVCFVVILVTPSPNDLSRSAWGTPAALISGAAGYVAGRRAK
jgi:hypothetical protein